MTDLESQLLGELEVAREAHARAVAINRAAREATNVSDFERRLIAAGIDQITADALANLDRRTPSVTATKRRVIKLEKRLAGLRAWQERQRRSA